MTKPHFSHCDLKQVEMGAFPLDERICVVMSTRLRTCGSPQAMGSMAKTSISGVLSDRARGAPLDEMTLQLPGFLKSRIRNVISVGSRARNFVIAAFISGLLISLPELACTG